MKKVVLFCLLSAVGLQSYAQDEDKDLHAVCPEQFSFSPDGKGCKKFDGKNYTPFDKKNSYAYLEGCRQLPGWAFLSWVGSKPTTKTEYEFIGAYIEKIGKGKDEKHTFWCSYTETSSFKSGYRHTPVVVQLALDAKKYEITGKSDDVADWYPVRHSRFHADSERMRCVGDDEGVSSDDCWVKIRKIEKPNP